MEDICMLIEIISVLELKVILSEEVKSHLSYALFDSFQVIPMLDVHNKEELAILLYLYKNPLCPVKKCRLYSTLTTLAPFDGVEYTMSDNFLVYSRQCEVDSYLITQHIASTYGIKYQTTPKNQYFIHYMSTAKKSASSN